MNVQDSSSNARFDRLCEMGNKFDAYLAKNAANSAKTPIPTELEVSTKRIQDLELRFKNIEDTQSKIGTAQKVAAIAACCVIAIPLAIKGLFGLASFSFQNTLARVLQENPGLSLDEATARANQILQDSAENLRGIGR